MFKNHQKNDRSAADTHIDWLWATIQTYSILDLQLLQQQRRPPAYVYTYKYITTYISI